MKAEFLHQYQQKNGIPFRSRIIGNFTRQMRLASVVPSFYNFIVNTPVLRRITNKLIGFHPDRSMPSIANKTLRSWFTNRKFTLPSERKVYIFCDEFTNYLDVEIGKKAILLLEALGYQVIITHHDESGRSYLSKGMLKKAKHIADNNIRHFAPLINTESPLVGIEPSAILSFRDEYPDISSPELKDRAKELAKNVFTIEEFLANELEKGHISEKQFSSENRQVIMHGHCYQKVLSSQQFTYSILSIPKNYVVQVIPSGCCGMAGSFGYEAEHYDVSQQVGELVLFPTIRKMANSVLIAASGTSCRHQIKDGTQRKALHPVEILFEALLGN